MKPFVVIRNVWKFIRTFPYRDAARYAFPVCCLTDKCRYHWEEIKSWHRPLPNPSDENIPITTKREDRILRQIALRVYLRQKRRELSSFIPLEVLQDKPADWNVKPVEEQSAVSETLESLKEKDVSKLLSERLSLFQTAIKEFVKGFKEGQKIQEKAWKNMNLDFDEAEPKKPSS